MAWQSALRTRASLLIRGLLSSSVEAKLALGLGRSSIVPRFSWILPMLLHIMNQMPTVRERRRKASNETVLKLA